MAKSLLFIGSDPKTFQSLKEILGGEFDLLGSSCLEEGLANALSRKFDLVIYDLDMAGGEGLEGYKKLRRGNPKAKVVVISTSNDIALAVAASKIGVADYLRKPLEAGRVIESISRNISEERRLPLNIEEVEGVEWLHGIGNELKALFAEVEDIIGSDDNVLLYGGAGIDKESLARLIHNSSSMRARRFARLDLASFGREFAENHFWATMQELLQERLGEAEDDELCGTVFLKGIEVVSDHFVLSILEFLKKRKGPSNLEKIDKGIRVILAIENAFKLAELEGASGLSGFIKCMIPPLRDRREDIPALVGAHLAALSNKLNKKIDSISVDALKFFMAYDWPGNYRELELVLSIGAQRTSSESIRLKDLPLSAGAVSEEYLSESTSFALPALNALRRGFEARLYELVLEDVNGDAERAAALLDIPKTAFFERARDLGLFPRR